MVTMKSNFYLVVTMYHSAVLRARRNEFQTVIFWHREPPSVHMSAVESGWITLKSIIMRLTSTFTVPERFTAASHSLQTHTQVCTTGWLLLWMALPSPLGSHLGCSILPNDTSTVCTVEPSHSWTTNQSSMLHNYWRRRKRHLKTSTIIISVGEK